MARLTLQIDCSINVDPVWPMKYTAISISAPCVIEFETPSLDEQIIYGRLGKNYGPRARYSSLGFLIQLPNPGSRYCMVKKTDANPSVSCITTK